MSATRCAIYTRKSSEEGLDQAFNSLDAQREAGLDYVKSQKHEGWKAIPTRYDDGGFSGGTMKRPGLERLLDDIERGRVDVVVVYKVDRLSRSLGDFARMMQLFDERGVSFVSVTQQFNTTTSMGRLTLNMLLSFAQFEREVAGERIRDKIAATKRKGYWVCGQPPLGYRLQRDGEPRGLYIIQKEADLVREIFRRFEQAHSLLEVAEALTAEGHTTKRWTSSTGREHGGRPLTRKTIYQTITNPVYIGKVTHTRAGKTEVYDGLHKPIIDQATWDRVQGLIESEDRATSHRWVHPHLLKGKLRTHEGFAMSPTSTQRPRSKPSPEDGVRHVPYYVSQKAIRQGFKTCAIKNINAAHLDDLVRAVVLDHLALPALDAQPQEIRDHWLREVIDGVTLAPDAITLRLCADRITDLTRRDFEPPADEPPPRPTCPYTPEVEDRGPEIRLTLRLQIKKHDGRRVLLAPDGQDLVLPAAPEPKTHIVNAIGLAYRWHNELIESGLSIEAFAKREGVSRAQIQKLLPLTNLGPEVLRGALAASVPALSTLTDLLRHGRSPDWRVQATSDSQHRVTL